MKRIILIILVFLSACEETYICNQNCITVISKAQPFQFYLNGETAYNDEVIPGVYSQCFRQVFDCDDIVTVYLGSQTPFQNTFADYLETFNASLGDWSNSDGSDAGAFQAWAWDGLGAAEADSGGSGGADNTKYLTYDNGGAGFLPGDYILTADVSNLPYGDQDAASMQLYTMPTAKTSQTIISGASESIPVGTGNSVSISFTLSTAVDVLAIRFNRSGGGGTYGINITIDDIGLTATLDDSDAILNIKNEAGSTISTTTFNTYIDINMGTLTCDALYSLEITEEDTTVYATTDLFAVRQIAATEPCVQISYSNNSTFDGILYGSSPALNFVVNIPAQFWKETFNEEFENDEKANNQFVRVFHRLAKKKRLETDYMPNYMHEKLRLILMHDIITINGDSWIKQDEYEQENINRYALSRGAVWLTKKDSIVKNVI